MWLMAEGSGELISGWWHSFGFNGSSSYVVVKKLKVLKVNLKSWNKNVFERVEEACLAKVGSLG